MYSVKIERDSISEASHRLTSMVWSYPRIVLAEVKTHRTIMQETEEVENFWPSKTLTAELSMNSASSRAIPVAKMLEMIVADPFRPFSWGKNQKGMQATEELSKDEQSQAKAIWDEAICNSIASVSKLLDSGVHKQIANRLLEPFSWVTQIVTGTDDNWANFFHLRCHEAAAPEFRHLARMTWLKYRESVPKLLQCGQWHLPFTSPEEEEEALVFNRKTGETPLHHLKLSAGRCARLSYLTHDGVRDPKADVELCDRLMGSSPVHASPAEHQGTPMSPKWEGISNLRSNLTGWLQFRKLLKDERITTYSPSEDEVNSWQIQNP